MKLPYPEVTLINWVTSYSVVDVFKYWLIFYFIFPAYQCKSEGMVFFLSLQDEVKTLTFGCVHKLKMKLSASLSSAT
jgi:hypothetical protein